MIVIEFEMAYVTPFDLPLLTLASVLAKNLEEIEVRRRGYS